MDMARYVNSELVKIEFWFCTVRIIEKTLLNYWGICLERHTSKIALIYQYHMIVKEMSKLISTVDSKHIYYKNDTPVYMVNERTLSNTLIGQNGTERKGIYIEQIMFC